MPPSAVLHYQEAWGPQNLFACVQTFYCLLHSLCHPSWSPPTPSLARCSSCITKLAAPSLDAPGPLPWISFTWRPTFMCCHFIFDVQLFHSTRVHSSSPSFPIVALARATPINHFKSCSSWHSFIMTDPQPFPGCCSC